MECRLYRGTVALQRRSTRSLTCQYRRHKPLFYIQPAREEVLNHKPRILLYHNAFSDTTIERIKELATPRVRTMERSAKIISQRIDNFFYIQNSRPVDEIE